MTDVSRCDLSKEKAEQHPQETLGAYCSYNRSNQCSLSSISVNGAPSPELGGLLAMCANYDEELIEPEYDYQPQRLFRRIRNRFR